MEMSCQSTAQKVAGEWGRNKAALDLSCIIWCGAGAGVSLNMSLNSLKCKFLSAKDSSCDM